LFFEGDQDMLPQGSIDLCQSAAEEPAWPLFRSNTEIEAPSLIAQLCRRTSLGGIKATRLAGLAKANLKGRVVLNRASDVEGTYAGAGAGIAVAGG
jgi:hypothetical protein